MRHCQLGRTALVTAVLLGALASRAGADGAVNISACQTLSSPNTVYKLTTDLQSCATCFVITADRITLDLQGHSVTSSCGQTNDGIRGSRDLTVIKNGTVQGYKNAISLGGPRTSLLGVAVRDSDIGMNLTGPKTLVKSCEASGNFLGIVVGDRGQVQQCNVHDNSGVGIIADGDNCLVTMNTLDKNPAGIQVGNGDKCTVSYNTVTASTGTGIEVGFNFGTGYLVTRNVVLNSGGFDYSISCPSDVTFNDSTSGFPASYELVGSGCRTAGNE